MAMLALPRRDLWLPGQPKPASGAQLDRTHPLNHGLVGCWLFNEGAGPAVNAVNNKLSLVPDGTRSPTGLTLTVDKYVTTDITPPAGALTLFARAQCTNDAYGSWITINSVNFEFIIPAVTTARPYVMTNGYGNYARFATPTAIRPTDSWAFVLPDSAQDAVSRALCWQNGIALPWFSATYTAAQLARSYVRIGHINPSYGFTGSVGFVMMYDRALAPSEIRQLHELTAHW